MPRVEVEGAGMLSFSVPGAQIAAIVGGRNGRLMAGARHDRRYVRAKRVADRSCQDQDWRKILGGEFRGHPFESEGRLGCDDAMVSAEIYKFLVYDRGGFFLAHRDTEKPPACSALCRDTPFTYRGGDCGSVIRAAKLLSKPTPSTPPSFPRCVLCRLRTRGSAPTGRESHLPGLQPHSETLEGQA